jgi:hypothetical protein
MFSLLILVGIIIIGFLALYLPYRPFNQLVTLIKERYPEKADKLPESFFSFYFTILDSRARYIWGVIFDNSEFKDEDIKILIKRIKRILITLIIIIIVYFPGLIMLREYFDILALR